MYLSHLTGHMDALVSIIETGLVYFPNERKVFSQITGRYGPSLREPQCRGMISLTDIGFEIGESHREAYGRYGVALYKDWVIRQGACKVLYVGEKGAVFEAFATLFSKLAPNVEPIGDEHLDRWMGELVRTRPGFAASVGGENYMELLKLHGKRPAITPCRRLPVSSYAVAAH